MGQVFNVPAGAPFALTVAKFIAARHASTPFGMADVVIWVPSPRLKQSLQQAFLDVGKGRAILPQIHAMSYSEELAEQLQFESSLDASDCINPVQKLVLLSRLIQAAYPEIKGSAAASQAAGLAALHDRLKAYGLNRDDLKQLVPSALSEHWQQNLDFIDIVLENYPAILAEAGLQDPAQKLIEWFEAQINAYLENKADSAIYAVGFADTTPAGKLLLKSIVSQAKGVLVLPGWQDLAQKVPPAHAQASLHELVHELQVEKNEIQPLDGDQGLWSKVWAGDALQVADLASQSIVECQNVEQEAQVCALILRQALEQESGTCAVVTPDKNMAARIKNILYARYNIHVDDSAGTPLLELPAGKLAVAVLDVVHKNFSPLALANLIYHPFVCGGMTRAEWLGKSRRLEKSLRKLPPATSGLAQLRRHINTPDALEIIDKIESAFKPFLRRRDSGLSEFSNQLRQVLDALTQTAEGARLLKGEDEKTLHQFLLQLGHDQPFSKSNTFDYNKEVLLGLLGQATVRPVDVNRQVMILGPLEARFSGVSKVVIAGVVEGTWPHEPQPNAWLSLHMLEKLGLPGPQKIAGLNAHDFTLIASAAKEVIYTMHLRSEDGAPVLPSRFLLRLEAALRKTEQAGEFESLVKRGAVWIDRLKGIQCIGKSTPVGQSVGRPAMKAVPKRWSASAVRDLMQCPYRFYAKRILRLKPLDEFEKLPDASVRGEVIHVILQAFFAPVKGLPLPFDERVGANNQDRALVHLRRIGEEAFNRIGNDAVRKAWWPRFTVMSKAFIDWLVENPARNIVACEVEGEIELNGIRLFAIADRLDKAEGGLCIIDYKTGTLPTATNIRLGYEPQLPVEGLIAAKGGFGHAEPLECMELWQVGGKPGAPLEISTPTDTKTSTEDILTDTQQGVERLTAAFVDENSKYCAVPGGSNALKPEGHCRLCDFAGICRMQEWCAQPLQEETAHE